MRKPCPSNDDLHGVPSRHSIDDGASTYRDRARAAWVTATLLPEQRVLRARNTSSAGCFPSRRLFVSTERGHSGRCYRRTALPEAFTRHKGTGATSHLRARSNSAVSGRACGISGLSCSAEEAPTQRGYAKFPEEANFGLVASDRLLSTSQLQSTRASNAPRQSRRSSLPRA